MCGIIAYIGSQPAHKVLLKGLKRLEYRGYDSAGIALLHKGEFHLHKAAGKLQELEKKLKETNFLQGQVGIGHTRWATHGAPTETNAHPHVSYNERLVLVHNGIIENYRDLQVQLQTAGIELKSETDTEVLGSFIAYMQEEHQCDLETAVRCALKQVVGAYALVLMDRTAPDTLVAARKGSPMVLGLGKEELFIASDITPLIDYTDQVVYINDQEIVTMTGNHFTITDLTSMLQSPEVCTLNMSVEAAEKSGYPHFMLKEIYEQPRSIGDCMRGRVLDTGRIQLGGVQRHEAALAQTKRVTFLACGTSLHASLVAKNLFESYARVPTEVVYASEYRYSDPVIHPGDVAIAVSQSGETADTLAAATFAKAHHATLLGICNVVSSSLARLSEAGVYTHAGLEIGVASTKAYTAQLVTLTMLALWGAQQRHTIEASVLKTLTEDLLNIPSQVQQVLSLDGMIQKIALKVAKATGCLFLGRGYNYPTALEGALKLKELAYIYATGYPAGEVKHGPIALITPETPTVLVAPQDAVYEKNLANAAEIKARGGYLIAVGTEGDTDLEKLADDFIPVPAVSEPLTPILSVIPLQLLSYHAGLARGCDVDKPRNLAKSVTVE